MAAQKIEQVKRLQVGDVVEAVRDLSLLCGTPLGVRGVVIKAYNETSGEPPVVRFVVARGPVNVNDLDVSAAMQDTRTPADRAMCLLPENSVPCTPFAPRFVSIDEANKTWEHPRYTHRTGGTNG